MGIPIFCRVKMKRVEAGSEPEGFWSLDSLTEV